MVPQLPQTGAHSTSVLGHTQGVHEDSQQLLVITIDCLPNELLVEIFDAYRQHFKGSNYQWLWTRKLVWFKLTHVCRKWRHVMCAAFCRLDLSLILETQHRDWNHRKIILSRLLPPLPIVIDYRSGRSTPEDRRGLLSTLERCDLVRGIALKEQFEFFAEFFEKTKRLFPILESLELRHGHAHTLAFPPSFLGGSAPQLQCLQVDPVSFASISGILSSATMLVDLRLETDTVFGPKPEESLPIYLQAMPCLRHLELRVSSRSIDALVHLPTNSEDIVHLPELTIFRYYGHSVFLNALVAGFSAPSLQELFVGLIDATSLPISHLPRFIDGLSQPHCTVQVILERESFRLSLLTKDEFYDIKEPRFKFYSTRFPESIMRISSALAARLATVERLFITFGPGTSDTWEHDIPWRKFLQQFHSIKVIGLEGGEIPDIASAFQPNQGGSVLDFLPALESINLHTSDIRANIYGESGLAYELEAFEPFTSAREQAGRPIKVSRFVGFQSSISYMQQFQ